MCMMNSFEDFLGGDNQVAHFLWWIFFKARRFYVLDKQSFCWIYAIPRFSLQLYLRVCIFLNDMFYSSQLHLFKKADLFFVNYNIVVLRHTRVNAIQKNV